MTPNRSLERRILGSAVAIGVAAIVVKCVKLLQDSVTASQCGAGSEMDAYLIAFCLVNYPIQSLFASLQSSLIPEYVGLLERDDRTGAESFLTALLVLTIPAALVIALAIRVFLDPILDLIASGFLETQRAAVAQLLLPLSAYLVMAAASTLLQGTLQARKLFTASALIPVSTPAIIILLLLCASGPAIPLLALGLFLGSAAEVVFMVLRLKAAGIGFGNPRACWSRVAVVGRQAAPMIGGSLFMAATALVEQAFAARAGIGVIASISYAMRIPYFLIAVFSVSLGGAMLPYLSSLVASGDWKECGRIHRRFALGSAIIGALAAGALIAATPQLVALFFERGAFNASDTETVSLLQRIYLLYIPAYLVGLCGVRLIIAAGRSAWLLWISGANLVIHLLLNLLFAPLMPVAGVALATTGMYYGSTLMIAFAVARILKDGGEKESQANREMRHA